MEKMTTFIFALFAHVCVHYLIRRNKTRSSFDPTDSQGTIRKKHLCLQKQDCYEFIATTKEKIITCGLWGMKQFCQSFE